MILSCLKPRKEVSYEWIYIIKRGNNLLFYKSNIKLPLTQEPEKNPRIYKTKD
jgi:hypothetical protein